MVVLLVAAAVAALVVQSQRATLTDARHRTLAAAQSFAHAPGLLEALEGDTPTATLQPLAEEARTAAGIDALIVYRLDGTTLTHSDTSQLGKHVIGPYAEAAEGRAFTSTFDGALGRSVVSAVPVKDAAGNVVAIVSAPVTVESVQNSVDRQLPVLLIGAGVAAALAAGCAALVSRRLRRQTRGLGPAAMTRMYEHHDAVLHAVREGVLITDDSGRLLLANDEARRLLDLPADAEGRRIDAIGLDADTAELLASDRIADDEVHLAADRLLSLNKRPTTPTGVHGTSVVTLRDTTELRVLAGRAELARERLRLLYDAGMRIGSTLDVVRTAEELAEAAVPGFADIATVELQDPVLHGDAPDGATTELRRSAVAGLAEDHPLYPVGRLIDFAPGTPMAASVRDGRAVIEPDLVATTGWRTQDLERARQILDYGIHSLMVVPLQARGVTLGLVNFWRTQNSPPFDDEDLAFAREVGGRAAVCIDNARRYSREHTMAATLQRSLMPRELPDQEALDVAHRYLPAQAGVGGDWFDVIPLPGARVALVVGDVVGHGLHAAVTMGRLRIAVHNFSALDLPPDELLGHLDDLVARIDGEEGDGPDSSQVMTGATCFYAVYDAVGGRVSAATAGHLPMAVAHPDGTVEFVRPPVSPPLGLGAGMPVEAVELAVPEGSRLVLYTDGLLAARDRDVDAAMSALDDVLGGPVRPPEETCDSVIESMLLARPVDDVALVVARTRLLARDRVAEWDVPSDPEAVGPVRRACARRLADWGLEHIGFGTELILSELITNAVRYGAEPIHVRLLLTQTLVCEVSDGSSTAPHIRRAADTDEGGRGLFLVARYAERWGTRYSPRGKTIWTSQSLTGGAPAEELSEDALLGQWDDLEI
ncbi:SpoIIE family protein phosphatase [Streptomyces sp. BE20]|uniref:SpoIIE family protein phosphatase n=1 Tax=unclassified Streptomyces TaxID=2593676 RepID=UPI002E789D82|nr:MULTISPECIES: SpoIIE family protein phosphatase [unclassified Streptomyces]MED7947378.1 SpoIIE family protein phosphatase [Streptomyces sp. BE303]MEE1827359.1 SpoIIE family protein phosphatase [Streptomyces sp. BE20]